MSKQDSNNCKEIQGIKMHSTVTVGTKGQIVIPSDIRKDLNINPGDNLITFTKHGKAIALVKTDDLNEFIKYIEKEISV